jgi:hypothetical protein
MPATKPKSVLEALHNVQKSLATSGLAKEGNNQFDGYNFRGIDQVYNNLGPLLAEHKLLILPQVLERSEQVYTNAKGTQMVRTVIRVRFVCKCVDCEGEEHIETFGEAADRSDKSTNKAMSAAMKYAMINAFCIPIVPGSVDDADSESPVVQEQLPPAGAMEYGQEPNVQAAVQELNQQVNVNKGPELQQPAQDFVPMSEALQIQTMVKSITALTEEAFWQWIKVQPGAWDQIPMSMYDSIVSTLQGLIAQQHGAAQGEQK